MSKPKIATVTGTINPDEFGHCQCHEHLFIRKGQSYNVNSALYMDDPQLTYRELSLYKQAGGDAVVDAQPVACGRMAKNLAMVSQESGIKVIASTGFHKLIFYPAKHWIHTEERAFFIKLFLSELVDGMFDDDIEWDYPKKRTDFKAGIIKVALDACGIVGQYIPLFEAAALVSITTGAPLLCHIEKDANAIELLNFFLKKGVAANKIIFCHLDRARYDFNHHLEMLKEGIYLEYDTLGRPKYHSDKNEVRLIKAMLEAGYNNSILMGLDTTRQRMQNYGGEIGLDYILKTFIPLMKKEGITDAQIERFFLHNPRQALTWKI